MTTEKVTTALSQSRHLQLDTPEEAREVFRANGRYGVSWYRGVEAAERSIAVANRIKEWLGVCENRGPDTVLAFTGEEVAYIITNLESARDNPADSHRDAARAVLQNMVYVEPAALPGAPAAGPYRLRPAS